MKRKCFTIYGLIIAFFLVLFVGQACAETVYHDRAELIRDGFLPPQEPIQLTVPRGEDFISYMVSQFEARAQLIDVRKFNLTPDAFRLAYTHLIDGRPDLFYVPSSWDYWRTEMGTVSEIEITYVYDEDETRTRMAAFQTAVNQVIIRASQANTALGKIMLVHDYLCVMFEYDSKGAAYSAEEMFRTGKGVCQGYLQCFQAVMNALNIPCVPVTSQKMAHGWNAVCVDGSWYHVDTTWDDSLASYALGVSHHNFMLSDAGMAATKQAHSEWSASVTASNTKYDNWFWRTLNTPVAVNQSTMYYAQPVGNGATRTVRAWDMNNSSTVDFCSYAIAAVDGTAMQATGFYPVCASQTHLYYMTMDRVYAVPLAGGVPELAYAVSGDRFFWSAYYDGKKIQLHPAPLPNGDGEDVSFSGTKAAITIAPNILHLFAGETAAFTARIIPGDVDTYTWTSSNASVAAVNAKGEVTAAAPGIAVIKANYAGELQTSRAVVVHSDTPTVLPQGTTTIAKQAFQGTGVIDVTLPEGVLTIGEHAFADCSELYCINLPSGLSSIADNAFENTSGVVFLCKQGTTGEAYVKEKKYSYISLP